jgi:F-type H+-transporting ATPase subunit beta
VHRARRLQRFLTQPFFASEAFTNIPGAFVPLEETLRGFREILDGKHDGLPEQVFYMVGTIDQAVERAREMATAGATHA